jgi:hypothetical protein
MGQVAFTVYFEAVPSRGLQTNPVRLPGKNEGRGRKSGRWDYYRSLGQLAIQTYEALQSAPGITLPCPPASQSQLRGPNYSDLAGATGVAPQFGESPNRFMVEAFTDMVDPQKYNPNTDTTVFSGNEVLSGDLGNQPWLKNPKTEVADEVALLKETLETAVASIVDDTGNAPKVYRIYYKGITWGDRGYHFPR